MSMKRPKMQNDYVIVEEDEEETKEVEKFYEELNGRSQQLGGQVVIGFSLNQLCLELWNQTELN